MKQNTDYDEVTKKEIYGEIFSLAVNPKILVGADLMIEFEKENEAENVASGLRSRHKEFGRT